jgi:hypothetical protein
MCTEGAAVDMSVVLWFHFDEENNEIACVNYNRC